MVTGFDEAKSSLDVFSIFFALLAFLERLTLLTWYFRACFVLFQMLFLSFPVVDVSLSVRGLDLAPQRSEELTASSKEDLRLMLSVLSGELVKVNFIRRHT